MVSMEYNIEFAEKLSEVAQWVAEEGLDDFSAQRTVLYLSLLSAEISMKALLERAGKPVSEIRGRSHRLAELLRDLGHCEVEVEIMPGKRHFVPATRLRGRPTLSDRSAPTVGDVLDAEKKGGRVFQAGSGTEMRSITTRLRS